MVISMKRLNVQQYYGHILDGKEFYELLKDALPVLHLLVFSRPFFLWVNTFLSRLTSASEVLLAFLNVSVYVHFQFPKRVFFQR